MEPNNLQEKVDSLSVFIRVFRHFRALLLSTIIGAAVAALLYYVVVDVIPGEPDYTSEATVYLEFEPGTLEAFQYFNAYTWRQIAKSNMITDLVMPFLPEDYSKEELVSSIWVELKADVRVMTLQIRSPKKERADVMMDAMIKGLGQFGENRPEFVSIYEIGVNEARRVPRKLLTERAAGLGAVCGFLLCLAVAFVKEILNNAIFTPTECKKRFGIFTEAVFLKNGKPWNDNEWELSKEKVASGVILALKPCELQKTMELTGTIKGYVYDELTVETVNELKKGDDVFLHVTWGETPGTQVEHIVFECEKRGINLTSVIITEADARFLKKYYRK